MIFSLRVMMSGAVLLAGSMLAASSAAAQESRPRLAVVVVVDQMRADYLERYHDLFGGGFARLMQQGAWFRNAWVDHAFTNSLPGHASVATGAYPNRHGVVDNIFRERTESGWALRSGMSLVDRSNGAPYGLGAATLPEWLQGSHPGSRFAAIGSNGAVRLYAGRRRGPVLWLSNEGQGYVTNSNYAPMPRWAVAFNDQRLPNLRPSSWEPSFPAELRRRLRADAASFENGGESFAFPHQLDDFDDFYQSPFADQATLELAAVAVAELRLGADATPDLLMISLNSLDEIGHAFGPLSHEQTDAVFRLDRYLGAFMRELDRLVGQDQWLLALTADHGVAVTPEQRQLDGSAEGRRVTQETAMAATEAAYAASANLEDAHERSLAAARALGRFEFVERVFVEQEIARFRADSDAVLEALLARSYWPGRIPEHPFYIRDLPVAELGVYVLVKEDVMMDWATAVHGSPYDYDRRVPLLMLGPGEGSGERWERAATVDVAPTIAAALGVRPLGEVDGRDLLSAEDGG